MMTAPREFTTLDARAKRFAIALCLAACFLVPAESDSALEFKPLAPAPGTTIEELERWTNWVVEGVLEPSDDGTSSEARWLLLEAEIAVATPAFINALHGLDMAKAEDVAAAARVVDHWFLRQAYVLYGVFPRNPERMEVRKSFVENWASWWEDVTSTPERLTEYRRKVRTRLEAIAAGTYRYEKPGR